MRMRSMAAACAVALGMGMVSAVAVGQEPAPAPQVAPAAEVAPTTTAPQPLPNAPTAIGVRLGDRVFYEGGTVAVTVGPAAFDDCPASWLCLWENAGYGGRMVQFQDAGSWQSLVPYGFNDLTSSWRNRRAVDARLGENAGGGTNICVGNGGSASYIGDAWNDRVSSVYITNSSTIC